MSGCIGGLAAILLCSPWNQRWRGIIILLDFSNLYKFSFSSFLAIIFYLPQMAIIMFISLNHLILVWLCCVVNFTRTYYPLSNLAHFELRSFLAFLFYPLQSLYFLLWNFRRLNQLQAMIKVTVKRFYSWTFIAKYFKLALISETVAHWKCLVLMVLIYKLMR